jgi:RNA polymerase-binding transcription factor
MTSNLTNTQLDELRRRLEEERTRIRRVLQAPAPTAPQPDQDTEIEEAAQRATERTRYLEIEARERALLAEVERALAKLQNGKYGVSETTGAPIPYNRLAAVPWTRHAIEDDA